MTLLQWAATAAGMVALTAGHAGADERARAQDALRRAIGFFHTQVSCEGGYLWRYSHDLTLREGEGVADAQTVWVQPPGTPAVGEAMLEVYQRTKLAEALQAARDAGTCLARGQLRSGGWTYSIRFDLQARERFAYRLDPPRTGAYNVSTLDDDTTQAATRFLLRLDRTLRGRDRLVRDAANTALEALLRNQYPNGAFPQGFETPPDPSLHPILRAEIPAEWPRTWPNRPYQRFYTINDNVMGDAIATLLLAAEVRRDRRFRDAAIRAGEFLLRAQLPEPQPAWAQQYDFAMQPAWARRFEPPAISAGESQQVLRTLLDLASATGQERFLEPIPRAVAYLRRSRLADGRLARFYELGTNRPLYFTTKYALTYSDDDLPTHYAFKVPDGLDAIEQRYASLLDAIRKRLGRSVAQAMRSRVPPAEEIRRIVEALDERGAWVEEGTLRYHPPGVGVTRVITSETFMRNVRALAAFVSASRTKVQSARHEGRFPRLRNLPRRAHHRLPVPHVHLG